MTEIAQIISKFQITLPKKVREDVKAKVGDLLVFVRQEDGAWRIQTIPKDPIAALRLAGKGLTPIDFRELHAEYENGWEDEYRE